jgi:hypothetical protein
LSAFSVGFCRELSVNDVETQLLAEDQPEPPRSRLEPHLELVRELRRRGRTFRRIAEILDQRFAIRVSPGTIHAFLTAKKRRRQTPPLSAPRPEAPAQSPNRFSPDERSAALAMIREANRAKEPEQKSDSPAFKHSDAPLTLELETEIEKEK